MMKLNLYESENIQLKSSLREKVVETYPTMKTNYEEFEKGFMIANKEQKNYSFNKIVSLIDKIETKG